MRKHIETGWAVLPISVNYKKMFSELRPSPPGEPSEIRICIFKSRAAARQWAFGRDKVIKVRISEVKPRKK